MARRRTKWNLRGFVRLPEQRPAQRVQVIYRVVCPDCGSKNIRYYTRQGCIRYYRCRNCTPDGKQPTRFRVIEKTPKPEER